MITNLTQTINVDTKVTILGNIITDPNTSKGKGKVHPCTGP